MKKSVTGPLWLLVIVGVIQSGVAYFGINAMVRAMTYAPNQGRLAGFILTMLFWPIVLFGEALVYWLIRRRNRALLLSWTHAAIVCIVFALNDFVTMVMVMHLPLAAVLRTRQGRIMWVVVFWALLIVAHVAFVQVLMVAFRKEPPPKTAEGEPENILDDVVL